MPFTKIEMIYILCFWGTYVILGIVLGLAHIGIGLWYFCQGNELDRKRFCTYFFVSGIACIFGCGLFVCMLEVIDVALYCRINII